MDIRGYCGSCCSLTSSFKILLPYVNEIGMNPIVSLLFGSFRSIGGSFVDRSVSSLLLLGYRKPILRDTTSFLLVRSYTL